MRICRVNSSGGRCSRDALSGSPCVQYDSISMLILALVMAKSEG